MLYEYDFIGEYSKLSKFNYLILRLFEVYTMFVWKLNSLM
jgi:hypothetical protein